MTRFNEPDLTTNTESPFVRDASNKLVRRNYWMWLWRKRLVPISPPTKKRAHLIDLKKEHMIFLPPEVPEPDSLGGWRSVSYEHSQKIKIEPKMEMSVTQSQMCQIGKPIIKWGVNRMTEGERRIKSCRHHWLLRTLITSESEQKKHELWRRKCKMPIQNR